MSQKKNILLVEDIQEERIALHETLQEWGFDVTAVGDGPSGLARFKADEYHLVISDLKMPHMDGIEFLSKIKEEKEEVPVVLISGYGTVEYAVEAMKQGAMDFLVKPFSPRVMEGLVKKAIGNGTCSKNDKYFASVENPIITNNGRLLQLLDLARTVAGSKAPVFIQGESGTGKELFARFIHNQGGGRERPFVALNCAALPSGLLESELFGHEKGAFTGAVSRKLGKFELAEGGTILLDEISEMDINLQAKLLRVLQESEVDRVGGRAPIPIDVRVIATTNRDIDTTVKAGKFRPDLYYRLNVIPIKLPPLRERREDILPLAEYFVRKYNQIDNRNAQGFTEDGAQALVQMDWPGNVRELENVTERAVLLCRGVRIGKDDLFLDVAPPPGDESSFPMTGSLKEMEKTMIFRALDQTDGNRTHAANLLGISVRTLRNKLHEYRERMDAI